MPDFSMLSFIKDKRAGRAHSREALQAFVQGLLKGEIPDYQVTAWLMAVVFQGMAIDELTEFTRLLAYTGEVLDLSGVPGPTVDKHSTGGVGDKVTLVLAPLLAACGATVAKLSGRGLGHTGGTVDKLEAIPGLNATLDDAAFLAQLRAIRVAVTGQSKALAPADGILYALRDVTGTVDSIPLIAASVLSKKIASGAQAILLDVKVGAGAFMPDMASARALAELMIEVGARLDRRVVCVVSGMDEPLGHAIGHANEVEEAIQTLRGQGPADLSELCLELAGLSLEAAGLASSKEEGRKRAEEAIATGRALESLRQLIVHQGGDAAVIEAPARMPRAAERRVLEAPASGYVQALDALGVGLAGKALGAGRARKGEAIDLAVGVMLLKKVGDRVEAGEPLAELLVNPASNAALAADLLLGAYRIGPERPEAAPLVRAVLKPVRA